MFDTQWWLSNAPYFVGYALAAGVVLWLLSRWVVNVSSTAIAVTERRYIGKTLEAGRAFAVDGQVGIQAKYLAPGLKLVPWPIVRVISKEPFFEIGPNELGIVTATDGASLPSGRIFAEDLAGDHHGNFQDPVAFLKNGGVRGEQLRFLTNGQFKLHPNLFKVRKIEKTRIPEGKVGVVVANDGKHLEPGQLVGRSVQGHDNFQMAEVFLRNGGQKGPQVDILRPGTYNIHTGMFRVEVRDAVTVGDGEIGVVEALGGQPMPANDVVADTPDGTNNFQDGEAFLRADGKRGPQTAILAPGTYYINPYLFTVQKRKQTVVQQGQVAVLIANHGKDPSELERGGTTGGANGPVEGNATDPAEGRLNDDNRMKHVVPEGYRGIQKEVLGPGRYNINPLIHQLVIVPTTMRSVEWAGDRPNGASQNEKVFDPFEVVSNDGFPMKVEVRCQYRILPENAPYVIAKLGSVEELERNVIHPQIDGIFRAEVSKSPAISYQQKRAEEQKKAEEEVRADLTKYKVEVVSVMITNIHLPPSLMETTQKRNLAEQQRAMYTEQKKTEETRREFEETRAVAENQSRIIAARSGIEVAEHEATQMAKKAEGDAKRIRLTADAEAEATQKVGEAEAAIIEKKGNASGAAFRAQAESLGQGGLTVVEALKLIAEGKIQITPTNLVTGGGSDGGANGTLGGLVTLLLAQSLNGNGSTAAPAAAPAPVPAADATEESAPKA